MNTHKSLFYYISASAKLNKILYSSIPGNGKHRIASTESLSYYPINNIMFYIVIFSLTFSLLMMFHNNQLFFSLLFFIMIYGCSGIIMQFSRAAEVKKGNNFLYNPFIVGFKYSFINEINKKLLLVEVNWSDVFSEDVNPYNYCYWGNIRKRRDFQDDILLHQKIHMHMVGSKNGGLSKKSVFYSIPLKETENKYEIDLCRLFSKDDILMKFSDLNKDDLFFGNNQNFFIEIIWNRPQTNFELNYYPDLSL